MCLFLLDILSIGKPLPPRNLRVVEVDSAYMVIEWETPEGDGGSPVTGFTVEKRDAKRDDFTHVATVDARTTKFRVTRLFEGTEYFFRVFAENEAGLSAPCSTQQPVKAKPPYGKRNSSAVLDLRI